MAESSPALTPAPSAFGQLGGRPRLPLLSRDKAEAAIFHFMKGYTFMDVPGAYRGFFWHHGIDVIKGKDRR